MPRSADGRTKFQREQDDYRKALATAADAITAQQTAMRELHTKLATSVKPTKPA